MNNMGKYIIADTRDKAEKLKQIGFDCIAIQEIGKETHYVFENSDKYLLFSNDEKSEYIISDELYMCF